MTALDTVKSLGAAGEFACQGDVVFAMGGRCLSAADVNAAIASATSCEACPAGWRVTSVDIFGDLIILEVRIDPPTVISLGPSL